MDTENIVVIDRNYEFNLSDKMILTIDASRRRLKLSSSACKNMKLKNQDCVSLYKIGKSFFIFKDDNGFRLTRSSSKRDDTSLTLNNTQLVAKLLKETGYDTDAWKGKPVRFELNKDKSELRGQPLFEIKS